MAVRMDVSSNTVQVELRFNQKHHEDAADILVRAFRTHGQRQALKNEYGRVRLRHVEMSKDKFDELVSLHHAFPAFRLSRYRALRWRGMLGSVCGVTVFENNELGNDLRFQYMDVLACEDSSLIDPMYISHPKATIGPFVDR